MTAAGVRHYRRTMGRLDLVVGIAATIGSLGATVALVIVCRKRIEKIARLSQPSLQEIIRELHGP